MVMGPTASVGKDLAWMHDHVYSHEWVSILDKTSEYSLLQVQGPISRDIMEKTFDRYKFTSSEPNASIQFSNNNLPFSWGRQMMIGRHSV